MRPEWLTRPVFSFKPLKWHMNISLSAGLKRNENKIKKLNRWGFYNENELTGEVFKSKFYIWSGKAQCPAEIKLSAAYFINQTTALLADWTCPYKDLTSNQPDCWSSSHFWAQNLVSLSGNANFNSRCNNMFKITTNMNNYMQPVSDISYMWMHISYQTIVQMTPTPKLGWDYMYVKCIWNM